MHLRQGRTTARSVTAGRAVVPALLLCVVLALVLAACENAPARPARDPLAQVSLSFTQLRVDEGTTTGRLRVVNGADTDLPVSGIGLAWSGYGEFTVPYETTVKPGRTLDLPMSMPTPRCPRPPEPPTDAVVGLVRSGADTVRRPLDRSGTGFVTRQWQRICNDLRVDAGVRLSYGDRFRLRGSGPTARLEGPLELTRGDDETLPIDLVEVRGTVIFDLALAGPARLAPGERSGTAPLRITSFRCDDHALGESSQTFYFGYVVRFGDEDPISVIRVPGARLRDLAQRLVARSCR